MMEECAWNLIPVVFLMSKLMSSFRFTHAVTSASCSNYTEVYKFGNVEDKTKTDALLIRSLEKDEDTGSKHNSNVPLLTVGQDGNLDLRKEIPHN